MSVQPSQIHLLTCPPPYEGGGNTEEVLYIGKDGGEKGRKMSMGNAKWGHWKAKKKDWKNDNASYC
jgi:hypothetical protein